MSSEDNVLDVRSLVPADRHKIIFETFRKLGDGESFILKNDHDPLPLYYQFDLGYPGGFSWEYLEEGPETWRVRIAKT